MNKNGPHGARKERYIRLPHWAEVAWELREDVDNVHSFELVAMEHRAAKADLKICGFAFETAVCPPLASYVQLEIRLSEDTMPVKALVRVVNVEGGSDDGPFRVEGHFLASSDDEMKGIARFVRKYF